MGDAGPCPGGLSSRPACTLAYSPWRGWSLPRRGERGHQPSPRVSLLKARRVSWTWGYQAQSSADPTPPARQPWPPPPATPSSAPLVPESQSSLRSRPHPHQPPCPPRSAARAPQEQTLQHRQVSVAQAPGGVGASARWSSLPYRWVRAQGRSSRPSAPPQAKPDRPQVRSRLLAPLARLPSTLGPISASSSCKPHQALPPQMSPFSSVPARNGGWGLGG